MCDSATPLFSVPAPAKSRRPARETRRKIEDFVHEVHNKTKKD